MTLHKKSGTINRLGVTENATFPLAGRCPEMGWQEYFLVSLAHCLREWGVRGKFAGGTVIFKAECRVNWQVGS